MEDKALPFVPPFEPRELTDHAVNLANEALTVVALDPPGAGGAHHLYEIRGFDSGTNPSDPFLARYQKPADHSTILFQNGPIKEVGVNGITQEALLAIVIDRLQCFQRGPFACSENEQALQNIGVALNYLKARTRRRMAEGVEGTHTPNVEQGSTLHTDEAT